jgi:hypothetical protein
VSRTTGIKLSNERGLMKGIQLGELFQPVLPERIRGTKGMVTVLLILNKGGTPGQRERRGGRSCSVAGTESYLLPRFFIKFVQILIDWVLLAARRAAHSNLLSADLEQDVLAARFTLHKNLDRPGRQEPESRSQQKTLMQSSPYF